MASATKLHREFVAQIVRMVQARLGPVGVLVPAKVIANHVGPPRTVDVQIRASTVTSTAIPLFAFVATPAVNDIVWLTPGPNHMCFGKLV